MGKPELPKAELERQAEHDFLSFLNEKNRPYNVTNLVDQFKGNVKSTMAKKVLDTLEEKKAIQVWEFGKTKIYAARQDQFEVPTAEELAEMDAACTALQTEFQEVSAAVKAASAEKRLLETAMTDQEIDTEITTLKTSCASMEAKLAQIQSGTQLVSAEDKEAAEKAYTLYRTAWKKRKRMAMECLNELSEKMDKKVSELAEKFGLETDEEVNVSLGEDLTAKKKPTTRSSR